MIKKGIPEDTAKTISESLQKSNVYDDFLNDKNIFFGESRMIFHHIDTYKKRDGQFTSQQDHHFAPQNNHIFYSDPRKNEIRGVYNVMNNQKKEVIFSDTDGEIIAFRKGNVSWGGKKIWKKHGKEGAIGQLSYPEFLQVGEIIKNGKKSIDKGRIVYDSSLPSSKNIFRVVLEEIEGKKVFTFYSNKNTTKSPLGDLSESNYGNQQTNTIFSISKNDDSVNNPENKIITEPVLTSFLAIQKLENKISKMKKITNSIYKSRNPIRGFELFLIF